MIKRTLGFEFHFLQKRESKGFTLYSKRWNNGYDNVIVGCTIENQDRADFRLSIFAELPIKHRNIICQPLIEEINIEEYLDNLI